MKPNPRDLAALPGSSPGAAAAVFLGCNAVRVDDAARLAHLSILAGAAAIGSIA